MELIATTLAVRVIGYCKQLSEAPPNPAHKKNLIISRGFRVSGLLFPWPSAWPDRRLQAQTLHHRLHRPSEPYGRPRATDRRMASHSASVGDSLTNWSQSVAWATGACLTQLQDQRQQ